jgi:cytochrome c553
MSKSCRAVSKQLVLALLVFAALFHLRPAHKMNPFTNSRRTLSMVSCRRSLAVLLTLSCHHAFAIEGGPLFKAQCVACHGTNGAGNATLQAPPLAGADKDYVVRQLRHFRNHLRGGDTPQGAVATMQAVALSLPDDAAVLALGGYVGSLKPLVTKGVAVPPGSSLNAGKALFSVCVACHGGQGEGTPVLGAPRLTHLPAWYLTTQLQAYRAGLRGFHADDLPGQQMRQVAIEALSDEEAVNAVVAYVVSLGSKGR